VNATESSTPPSSVLRFPLYAKILLWFFLNLVLLAAVFFLVFRAQFGLGVDWLLSGSTAARLEATSRLILAELTDRPRAQWNDTLRRFGGVYGVKLHLFRNADEQLAGEDLKLPRQVRVRLLEPLAAAPRARAPRRPERTPPPISHGVAQPPESPPPPAPPAHASIEHLSAHEPLPKVLVRTADPTRYWICVRGIVRRPEQEPLPVVLVAVSDSLSAGGLLLDVKPWVMAGIGSVLLSALLWFPFVRGITRSVAQMTQATRHIAEGRFDVRVDDQRRDELGSLGAAINQMASRLSGFVNGQKRFLGDIAHELCSPLAKLQVSLGILEQRAADDQQRYVSTACEKADHMSALVNQLLSFSKASLGASAIKLKPVSLLEAVRLAIDRESDPGDPGVALKVEVPADLSVLAETELLVSAVSNLLRNAIRYAGQAGPVTISAQPRNPWVILMVADHGPGIPEEHLAHVFDPFYRLDPSRDRSTGGVGLGLTLVKTCVESCGGTVTCRNRKPGGLEVILQLSRSGA
jgi:two-component system sensor histidine kinase CpxA